jgi:hypothetical protein
MFGSREWRRRRLMKKPLPPEWLAIVERNMPYYQLLPSEQQRMLQGLVQVFLSEKRFEGCGGLELTDEIRVTIAAQGCVLLLARETDVYPELRSVLVYPNAYIANVTARQPDGTVVEGWQGRLGESWTQGYVVLSWDEVLRDASDIHDGRNVVFHEFAHQLDSESGAAEGAPLLPESSMYDDWARVFGAEYQALCDNVERDEPTLLDAYGTVSPAEFFAVATEFFFELPLELEAHHPELYGQLKLFYRQDPALLMRTA